MSEFTCRGANVGRRKHDHSSLLNNEFNTVGFIVDTIIGLIVAIVSVFERCVVS